MIYLVEDDESIRKLVSYALTKEGFEVKDFAMPSEFKKSLSSCIPDLVLLDIMLPEQDGLSILKELRSNPKTENISIIMLTAKGSEYDKVTGLDMGADDYISKPFGITELTARVRAVLRRSDRLKENKKEYTVGSIYINPEKHIIEVNGEEINLSFKEYSLLLLLIEANGNVVSRETLLSKIWGDFYEESRTLDVHIRKLRVKLKDAGNLIQTVKNIGYKIEVN